MSNKSNDSDTKNNNPVQDIFERLISIRNEAESISCESPIAQTFYLGGLAALGLAISQISLASAIEGDGDESVDGSADVKNHSPL